MSVKIPHFVNKENRYNWYMMSGVFFITLYFLTNNFQAIEPRILPFSFLDVLVPFWPSTAFIYVSDYLFPFVMAYGVSDKRRMNILVVSFLLVAIFANLIFFVMPTGIPRHLYPIYDNTSLLYFVRILDQPTNCFPSCHVALVWQSYLVWKEEHPNWAPLALFWAILIMISTLTTKQHYAWDIVGGLSIAHISVRLAQVLVK